MRLALLLLVNEVFVRASAASVATRGDPRQRRQLSHGLRPRQYSNSTALKFGASSSLPSTIASPGSEVAAEVSVDSIQDVEPAQQLSSLLSVELAGDGPASPPALTPASPSPASPSPAAFGATSAATSDTPKPPTSSPGTALLLDLDISQVSSASILSLNDPTATFDDLIPADDPFIPSIGGPVSGAVGGTPTNTNVPSLITPPAELPPSIVTLQNVNPGGWNSTTRANASCGSCTVNVRAGLRWWFPNPLFHDIASLSVDTINDTEAYTLVPNTRTYNLTSVMQEGFVTFSYTTYFAASVNSTVSDLVMANAPLPTAATTVVFTQTDVIKPFATGWIPADQQSKLFPASTAKPFIAAPTASGRAVTATFSTNLLYYTAYEVEKTTQTTDSLGNVVCATTTVTYQIQTPYVYNYDDPYMTLGSSLAASGTVVAGFMSRIPESACSPGTWLAPEPTMYVVVEETFQRAPRLFAIHHQTTVTGSLIAPSLGNGGGAPSPTSTTKDVVTPITEPTISKDSGNVNGIGFVNNPGGKPTVTGNQPAGYVPNNGAAAAQHDGQGGTLPAVTSIPSIKIGDTVYVPDSQGKYNIQGQSLGPGGQIVVSGNTVSLGPAAQSLVVNGITITRPATLPSNAPPIVIAGTTVVAQMGGPSYIIAGQTLTPGAVVTANGNTISLGRGSSASVVVVNGQTQNLVPINASPTINVAGTQYTEQPGGLFVIGGQTLRPGKIVTVAGTTLSFPMDASALVVNGVTSTLLPMINPALVVGSTTYPAAYGPDGVYVVSGQTLTPGGPAITLSGSTYSLAPSGTALVVNGVTTTLSPATASPAAVSAAVTDAAVIGSSTRGASTVSTTTKKAAAIAVSTIDSRISMLIAVCALVAFPLH